MSIVNYSGLLGGIRKLFETKKAKEAVTSRLLDDQGQEIPAENWLSNSLARLNDAAAEQNARTLRGETTFDPGGAQIFDTLATKAGTAVGMNPNDIEGSKMMLGIMGAGAGVPVVNPGVIGELPLGIGQNFMRNLKETNPAKYSKWLQLFEKKMGFDPHKPMDLIRSQQEDTQIPVSFGGRLATFFTPANRKNVAGYNNPAGSTEGGGYDVSAIANLNNPIVVREGSGFIGDRGVGMVEGGKRTYGDLGSYFDSTFPSTNEIAGRAAPRIVPSQILREQATSRDPSTALKESVFTAYANKGGHDYVVKVRPDINKPTQILHTDLKAVNANKRKYLEEIGNAPSRENPIAQVLPTLGKSSSSQSWLPKPVAAMNKKIENTLAWDYKTHESPHANVAIALEDIFNGSKPSDYMSKDAYKNYINHLEEAHADGASYPSLFSKATQYMKDNHPAAAHELNLPGTGTFLEPTYSAYGLQQILHEAPAFKKLSNGEQTELANKVMDMWSKDHNMGQMDTKNMLVDFVKSKQPKSVTTTTTTSTSPLFYSNWMDKPGVKEKVKAINNGVPFGDPGFYSKDNPFKPKLTEFNTPKAYHKAMDDYLKFMYETYATEKVQK
jgi:hypothetical protein